MRIVLTLQLWHRSLVTYRETLVGLVCIMNLGGIAMGMPWDCHVIAMGLNLGGIAMRSNSGGITKEFMKMKIPSKLKLIILSYVNFENYREV